VDIFFLHSDLILIILISNGQFVFCGLLNSHSNDQPTISLVGVSGPTVSLGTLNWTFTQVGVGVYGLLVFNTGSLAATPAGDGIMSLTGHAWLAGDPMTIEVSTNSEPSTGLVGMAALSLAAALRRR
jgi:MYXO-CTERM domain-containing protein